MDMDVALVYMVAGISSRFGGKVKQFAPVGKNGETLIESSLNQALPAGFTKIIFIVGEKTEDLFMEKFGDEYKGVPVYYTFQEYDEETRDRPWGTTDALCTIEEIVDCPFVICNGDDLYGETAFRVAADYISDPENKGESITMGYQLEEVLPEEGSVNRGIFQVNEESYVTNLVEVLNIEKNNLQASGLTGDNFCSMNIFGFSLDVIGELKKILEKFKQEHQGDRKAECYLPNNVSQLIKEGKIIMKIYSTPDKWYGLTNPEDEEKIRQELAKG